MVILEAQNLAKSFGGVTAISGLDLSLNRGEITGLIGPNGCGKTTLFNLITGFLKPDCGEIIFEGKKITYFKPYRLCQLGIARTFQLIKPFAQMTTLENVAAARLYGSDPTRSMRRAKSEAAEILEFIGFRRKREVMANDLGLVDRKTLELGRALATRPKLLLLDEMMAGLNPVEVETSMRLIQRIRASGITVVVVEHVMKAVLGISDRVIVLSVGKKIAEGTPKQVASDKQVIEAYLGEEIHAQA